MTLKSDLDSAKVVSRSMALWHYGTEHADHLGAEPA